MQDPQGLQSSDTNRSCGFLTCRLQPAGTAPGFSIEGRHSPGHASVQGSPKRIRSRNTKSIKARRLTNRSMMDQRDADHQASEYGRLKPKFPWCIWHEGPPVPIPNTEVKPHSAHGTAGIFRGRVGLRQGLFQNGHPGFTPGWPFFVLKRFKIILI
jgi:hypothetical protein